MEKIKLIPLVGMEFSDAKIALASSQKDVKNLFGEPYSTRNHSLFYFNNELRFDFDDDGSIEFIEFLGGFDGKLQPVIYGVSAFRTPADTLYNVLSKENQGEIDDSEDGYSYGFLNISVGVYRLSVPQDVEDLIAEAIADKKPMDEAEIEDEMKKANYWATIGRLFPLIPAKPLRKCVLPGYNLHNSPPVPLI